MLLNKLLGSALILGSSLWAGLRAAAGLRRTQRELRELSAALEGLAGEIRYAAPPFVPLCRRAAAGCGGAVRGFFEALAGAGERPDSCRAGMTRAACREAGLALPEPALAALERLFDGFGLADREGQLGQLALAAEALRRLEQERSLQLAGRCRSCEMLGLSAGAAVLVLVL